MRVLGRLFCGRFRSCLFVNYVGMSTRSCCTLSALFLVIEESVPWSCAMYLIVDVDVDVEIRQAQAKPLSLLLAYTF